MIVKKDGSIICQINNLIAMDENICIHNLGDGEMRFVETARVRVKGEESNPTRVFELLEREDVEVYFLERLIFPAGNWRADQVERFCNDVQTVPATIRETDDEEEDEPDEPDEPWKN